VLEIGCGDCDGVPLASIAGALYVGVDIDLAALHMAILRRAIHCQSTINQTALHFIQADIAHLPLRAHFDLILVRHPDVDRHRAAWERAFRGIVPLLTRAGILIVTTYSVAETETIRGWLGTTGLIHLPLDTGRLAETDLIGRDRFVIAYHRI
jgi:SAM-dependent methyltransferase